MPRRRRAGRSTARGRANARLASVTDRDGGPVVGVVALEDVLEELVGEIRDEATAGHPG